MQKFLKTPHEPFIVLVTKFIQSTAANGKTDHQGLQYLISRFCDDRPDADLLLAKLLASYTRKEPILHEDNNKKHPIDFIAVGLAYLKRIPERKYYWVTTEPMTAIALRHHFNQGSLTKDTLSPLYHIVSNEYTNPSIAAKERGFHLERYISLGIAFNCFGKPLSEFYKFQDAELAEMPKWFRDPSVIFSAEHIEGWTNQETARIIKGHIETPPSSLSAYLEQENAHRFIFLPPESKAHKIRPDIALLLTNSEPSHSQTVLKLVNPSESIPASLKKRVLMLISVKSSCMYFYLTYDIYLFSGLD